MLIHFTFEMRKEIKDQLEHLLDVLAGVLLANLAGHHLKELLELDGAVAVVVNAITAGLVGYFGVAVVATAVVVTGILARVDAALTTDVVAIGEAVTVVIDAVAAIGR